MALNRLANFKIFLLLVSILIIGCTNGENKLKETYSGDGFVIEYPANWVIGDVTDSIRKNGTVFLLEPEGLNISKENPESFDPGSVITLTIGKRRIVHVPDGVKTYSEWHTLQFSDNDYFVSSISSRDIHGEPVTNVLYYRDKAGGGNCRRFIGNAFYFNKYLIDKKNNRMTFVIASFSNCIDKDLLSEAIGIMESIKVNKYSW